MRFSRNTVSVVLFCVGVACASASGAATFVVESTIDAPDALPGDGVCASDEGACTLRAATMEANAMPGHDTIEVPAGIYALTLTPAAWFLLDGSNGSLFLDDDATIVGAGAESTIIDASMLNDSVLKAYGNKHNYQPRFHIEIAGVTVTGGGTWYLGDACAGIGYQGNGTFTVRDAVFTNNHARGNGGGICFNGYRQGGQLFVIDSTITGNSGQSGGGIYGGGGEAELTRTVITENKTFNHKSWDNGYWGGGLYFVGGQLEIVDCEISDNFAGRAGGGVGAVLADVHLERTTVSGNIADEVWEQFDRYDDGAGGGIWADHTRLRVFNSTISGNTAAHRGGGVFLMEGYGYPYGTFQPQDPGYFFAFSTITGNRNLSGIEGAGVATVLEHDQEFHYELLKGTIISGNLTDGIVSNCNLFSPAESLGFNIDNDDSCGLYQPSDRPAVDPDFEALADNGGPTATHGLLPSSVAIDLVPYPECRIPWNADWPWDRFPFTVDQRGVGRPVGDACDAGSFEFEEELTVEETIEELIVDVRGLIDDGEVSYSRGRSLIAELQVALWFLKFSGGETIAAVRIQLFIIKVESMIRNDLVDPEIGNELLTRARQILEILQS